MPLKKIIYTIVIALIGITGLYIIIASGQVPLDPYSIILTLIVAGVAVYFYITLGRRQV